ncbi:phosphotriesterase [uncultured Faecalibaculum sp.]|uniref:phosphotriesterase family protein n=1 Tax=uncultured Faecalibaculum sp. TaxID=1729681 RepID=UPI00262ECC70|nr:hypothetical protein [uncultured Faecalibaculum sp.]
MESLIHDGTMMHEHMHMDLSRIKQDPDTCLDCHDQTLKELRQLREAGITRILDVTNIGMGRDLDLLRRLEAESGVTIVRSTGFYKDPFIPAEWQDATAEEMAATMVRDIQEGNAAVIGEVGTSRNEWTDNEQKLFDAALLAHQATGAPIYTHTTLGTLALEQAKFLTEHGADPKKVIIGHVDLAGDLDTIRQVLDTGVTVGFDTVGKTNYLPDETRVKMLRQLEQEGRTDQIVLSMDITRRSQLADVAGPGYRYLMDGFVPMLLAAGMQEETIRQMLETNPDRILGRRQS